MREQDESRADEGSLSDTPSRVVREHAERSKGPGFPRYTLTCSEGTLSVYAAFSRLKHLVVQIAQMSFWSLISIFNMLKLTFFITGFLKIFLNLSFFYLL